MLRSRGHGTIINMSSYSPFVFTYNPEKIETQKKINYSIAPNIGGASKRRYFSGFDSKEVSFKLVCIDMESPTGVADEIAFFEALREPDPGIAGGWGMTYGNENYPPPQVLFQFGISYLPLVWDVLNVQIEEDHFYAGQVRGVLGIPKKVEINIELALDEEHPINLANQIAKKADMYVASAKSLTREVLHKAKGTRKEMPGMFGNKGLLDRRISLRW
jgi:hypothetical protein